MSKPVIEIHGVSKSYQLGTIGATRLFEDANRLWRRLRGEVEAPTRHFKALNDVSFDVSSGDVVGLIGRNGAGKSTLLKILSRITEPTSGELILRGRVASLLEVGTGFVGDLTGRENIFLNGAILGMSRAETRAKFDEIVAFAEVDQFIDTPVKRYSSGMYVRLAFAVAAHLEPEILIVDEVLAVGDAQFQKKCLGKMNDVSSHGRTIIFVSHNMTAVQSLCRRAIHLSGGMVVADGDCSGVVAQYLRASTDGNTVCEWEHLESAPGSEELRLRRIEVAPIGETPEGLITMQAPLRINADLVCQSTSLLHITFHLMTEDGITVLTSGSPAECRAIGEYRAGVTIPANLLNSGSYSLKFLVVQDENRVIHSSDAVISFSVIDAAARSTVFHGREPGVVNVPLPWIIRPLNRSEPTGGGSCSETH